MAKPDGGPAFPVLDIVEGQLSSSSEGMSLRDYFAAHAIAVIPGDSREDVEDLAADAYKIANAMLAERAKWL